MPSGSFWSGFGESATSQFEKALESRRKRMERQQETEEKMRLRSTEPSYQIQRQVADSLAAMLTSGQRVQPEADVLERQAAEGAFGQAPNLQSLLAQRSPQAQATDRAGQLISTLNKMGIGGLSGEGITFKTPQYDLGTAIAEILSGRNQPIGDVQSEESPLELQGVSLTAGGRPIVRYGKPKEKKLSESIQRDFSRVSAFEGSLGDLQNLVKDVPKGVVAGNLVSAGAFLTGGRGVEEIGFQKETARNAVTYNQLRPGIAAGLYRAVTGDDRISDRDAAARALPFVPPLSLDPDAFNLRLQIIQRAIQRKRAAIQEAARTGRESAPFSALDFTSVMRQAEQEISGAGGVGRETRSGLRYTIEE